MRSKRASHKATRRTARGAHLKWYCAGCDGWHAMGRPVAGIVGGQAVCSLALRMARKQGERAGGPPSAA